MAEVGDRGRLQRSSIAYSQATDCIRQLVAQLGGEVTMNSIFFYFDFRTHWKGFSSAHLEQVGKLRDSLASSSSRLTGHELNRRRDLLDSLQRKERSLRDVVGEKI